MNEKKVKKEEHKNITEIEKTKPKKRKKYYDPKRKGNKYYYADKE